MPPGPLRTTFLQSTIFIGSTHGTYHNKNKCFAKTYYRFRVGHGVKFGGSTRLLILQGPEEDMEDESGLSVTELKEKALEKARLKGAGNIDLNT